MEPDNEVQLSLLRELDRILRRAHIRYWLRGGWALDFLLGEITRQHGDIDLVIWKRHAGRVQRVLREARYAGEHTTMPATDAKFSKRGQDISVLFIERGQPGMLATAGFKDSRWSEDVLRGRGCLADLTCRVISARGLLEEKEKTPGWLGRPVRDKDIESMALLQQLIREGALT